MIGGVGFAAVSARQIRDRPAFRRPEQKIVVGSKDFTESIILAEILAQMLEKRGVAVERQFELGGNLPHDSLLSNQIDVYPEYTGTAYTAILKHTPLTDPQAVYDQTKTEYAEKFDLVVEPAARVCE